MQIGSIDSDKVVISTADGRTITIQDHLPVQISPAEIAEPAPQEAPAPTPEPEAAPADPADPVAPPVDVPPADQPAGQA